MNWSSNGLGSLQSEINVTPLVDVVLVLLILFMVVVPLALHGYDLDIPGQVAAAPTDPNREEQIVLTLDDPGLSRVRVNDEVVTVTDLARRIAEIFSSRRAEDRVLFLDAEDGLNYEEVLRVVDLARSGVSGLRVGLIGATEPPSAGP